MWTSDFRAGIVGVDPGGGSTVAFLRAIKSFSSRSEDEIRTEIASGSIFADTVYKAASLPMATFASEDIDGAAAWMPFGTCLTATTDTGIELYGQLQDCSGVAASGHQKYQIKLGVMVPRSLTVEHQGNATLSWDIYARWDGTNDPIVRSAGVALPSSTATVVQRFQMEQMLVAGNTIEGKRSITLDFNPTVLRESADSDAWPSVVSVSDFKPRLTVRGVDPTWLADIGLAGSTCLIGDSNFELRARGVSRASAAHTLVSFAGLATIETLADANNASPAETVLVVNIGSIANGVNAPITWQTGQSLTP